MATKPPTRKYRYPNHLPIDSSWIIMFVRPPTLFRHRVGGFANPCRCLQRQRPQSKNHPETHGNHALVGDFNKDLHIIRTISRGFKLLKKITGMGFRWIYDSFKDRRGCLWIKRSFFRVFLRRACHPWKSWEHHLFDFPKNDFLAQWPF